MITLNMIKSAPVGPVAGGIMGCIMVLVLAVYAYRHQIHRRSHQHMSPLAAQGEREIVGWEFKIKLKPKTKAQNKKTKQTKTKKAHKTKPTNQPKIKIQTLFPWFCFSAPFVFPFCQPL